MNPLCPDCGAEMKRAVIDGKIIWQCPKPDCLYVMPIDNEGAAPRRK